MPPRLAAPAPESALLPIFSAKFEILEVMGLNCNMELFPYPKFSIRHFSMAA